MPSARRRPRQRHPLAFGVAAVLIAWATLAAAARQPAGVSTTDEVRALWVLRTTLTSDDKVAALVDAARRHGFNTLLVQVRGRGDAWFTGGLEPRPPDLGSRPMFDPLAAVIEQAHAAGLAVHAWTNVNLVSSAAILPAQPTHLVNRHPEWLMVPRELAPALSTVSPASKSYVARLAAWSRVHVAAVEGLYASPVVPGAVDHVEAVVRDFTRRYALDGVHFDYARYPTASFDYSRGAIAEFKAVVRPLLTAAERQRLDARERRSPTVYPDTFPARWREFRIERMTALMRRLRDAVKAERPGAIVSVAVKPDVRDALDERLQDWRTWLTSGIVDVVCPMAYTEDQAVFASQIAAAEAAAGRSLWAGIGAWRLPVDRTVENIRTARRLGASGVVLFSYDSLADPRVAGPGALRQIGRQAFDAEPSAGRPQ